MELPWGVSINRTPKSTVQKLPLGEAGSPVGETDEGSGAALNVVETDGESAEAPKSFPWGKLARLWARLMREAGRRKTL